MGFGLIAIGFVFLFNPIFNIIDFIPDFIGILFIYAGLSKISVLNEDIASARRKMIYLALIDIAKLVSVVFLSSQDGTRYLMLATVFGLLECICFIPAVHELVLGVEHLGMKYGSASVNRTYQKKKGGNVREYSNTAKKVTIAFYIYRNFFALAPELTELQGYDYSGIVDSRIIKLSLLKPTLYLFSAIAVIIFGVFFLSKGVKFWITVKQDKPFTDALANKYNSFTEKNKNFLSAVKMNGILIAAATATVSVFTLSPNSMWIFPTALCALITGISSVSICGIKKAIPVIIPASLSILLSAVTIILDGAFNEKFELNDIFQTLFPDATAAYFNLSIVYLFEKLCLTVAFVIFLFILRKKSLDFIPVSVKIRSASNKDNEALKNEIMCKIKKKYSAYTAFSAITLMFSSVLPYIFYGTGTVFEANKNILLTEEGSLTIKLLLTSSYSTYIGIFSVFVVISLALIISLRSYMKSELLDPICDWGRET